MKYDDLIGAPYEKYGNCWGLIVECCRRDNKPIKDLFSDKEKLAVGLEIGYMDKLNVREIEKPKAGAIVECRTGENIHVGYMVTNSLVLHTTKSHGARITHVQALNPIKYYEVI